MGKEWDSYAFESQMSTYHNQTHFIVVHGAHEANLLASKSHAKVIELMPFAVDPMPSMEVSAKNVSFKSTEYYGQSGWFASFTRRLDMDHFTWGDDTTGGKNPFDSREINFQLPGLIDFVADRFQLVRRSNNTTSQQN